MARTQRAQAHRPVTLLPIELPHALLARSLPPHRRDPFDRVIVAQAQVNRLAIVTSDRVLAAYDVPLIVATK
jgi:PIN domain nuclease of toxin-antitoxin system